jgi:anionic cell wall polymer biosynthesis LytR-Cps2A-Psr (LCP) family protein
MGIDSRASGTSGSHLKNTDTIMMITLDHLSGKLVFVSFPRDLYVYYTRPNGTPTAFKINGVYAIDGIPGIKTVVEQITSKKIHYYAMVDLALVEEVIDSLGGVTVTVDHDFEELYPCADIPKNRECPRPIFSLDGYFGQFTFKKGTHTFDSFKALVYSRARKYTSDFARAKRQQDILRAMLDRAINTQVPLAERVGLYFDLYNKFQKRVITNIELQDVAAIFKIIDKLDSEVGWSIGFVDKSHQDFQNFLNSVIRNLPYYIEKPRILIVNASGAKLTAESPIRKILRNNPYLKFKIVTADYIQTGTKLYDLSNGGKAGSLRDINQAMPHSLIFNSDLDQIGQSSFKEQIVVIVGQS